MKEALTPKQLAELTGISRSYSSQIVSGTRPCPPEIALTAFRAFGVRLGLLAEMTDADIAKLVAQQLTPAECDGCDAAASAGDEPHFDRLSANGDDETAVHSATDSAPLPPPSTGQNGAMSRDNSHEGMTV